MRLLSKKKPARGSAAGPPRRASILASIALLILLTFAVDLSFERIAFGGFYAIPILISLWLRDFRITLGLTVLCCALNLGEVFRIGFMGFGGDSIEPITIRQLIGNHGVQLASLVIVCVIGHWRLRDERELEQSRATTATTLASIADGVITLDAERRITYANSKALDMTGASLEQALGQPLDSVLRVCEESALHATIEDMPADSIGPRQSRAMLIPRHGPQIRIEILNSILRGPEGAQRGEVVVFRDITEREQREKEMRTLAYRDTLTNLPNRLSLHERLNLELAHARRDKGSLAVLFIDLDEFKAVNDTMGHAAGDELLRATAARLRSNLRETDTVARLGGDEFAIVLPGAESVRDAELVAAKLLSALEEPVPFEGQILRAKASIGVAMFPEDGIEADVLLRRSDEAMYRAKQRGGGKAVPSSAPGPRKGRARPSQ